MREELKPEELRIGNYIGIIDPGIETPCTIEHIKFIADGDKIYKPIPLSEEWLIKFGFQLIKNDNPSPSDWYWCHGRLHGCFMYETMLYSNGGGAFKYVHQLQNLYFALTNSELSIKETVTT